jgi:hypothetical protein
MALTTCSECHKQISDKAAACPSCGNPLKGVVTTIELTSKKWKKKSIWGVVFLLLGFILIFKGGEFALFGTFLVVAALATIISAKVGAWWTNG